MDILSGLTAGLVMTIPLIPASMGFYLALRCLKFPDLTIQGSFVFGLVTTAYFIEQYNSPFLALLISLIGGAIFGSITGLLHMKLKVPSFASGIITSFFGTTLNYYILQKAFNSPAPIQERNISNRGYFEHFHQLDINSLHIGQYWFYTIISITAVCVILLFIVWLVVKSNYGRKISMFGNNRQVAAIYSINSDYFMIIGLSFTNLLVGFSGFLCAQVYKSVDIGQGTTILIPLLASVVIGEFIVNVLKKKNSLNFVSKPLLSSFWGISSAPFIGFFLYNVIVLIFSTVFVPSIQTSENYSKYAISGLMILAIMFFNKKYYSTNNQDDLI
jgi:putative ABC transport system permease protein